MAADEWKLCVDWLVQCRILPSDHKATQPDAQAFDLAQALRDGVLLCHLLNSLKQYSVDAKDFSPRPQLSQFLCLKNIRTFLVTCEKVFKVDSKDLFEPPDLFDVTNFRKVLHTLSKLSKTELAQKDGRSGFPPHNDRHNEMEEDIYGNLSDMAINHGIEDNEDLYDSVYQEGDDEIYEDIVSTKRRRTPQRSSVSSGSSRSELPPPKTKRDYCIKEMCDTERNYVDALNMIHDKFIIPLRTVISVQDKDIIFSTIETMLSVHKDFYQELYRACTVNKPKIHDVFIKWKQKFLTYGEYCSNLPRAQEHIEELLKKNDALKGKIEECERAANEGRFRLRDLLHVPMQRVLKYHLLLRELLKNTDRNNEDQFYLQQALEAMQDLSLYVNEVKRDNEALALIQEIQNSITDLQMPQNTSLRDYGRLQKDGELKVRSHLDNKVRQRYIFLFDKVMLMAKARGDSYSFKEAIVLAEYKVDNSSALRDGARRTDRCTFQIVKQDDSMAYTFLAKTDDIKMKWIEAIKLALDNTQPAAGKNYVMTTFNEPKVCDICRKLLRGVFFQGYKCQSNNMCVHKECIGKLKQEPAPRPPQRPEKYQAKVDYTDMQPLPGGDRRPLRFRSGDIIMVLVRDNDWWKGQVEGHDMVGWFPQQYVEEAKKLCYEEATISAPGHVQIQGQLGSRPSIELSNYPWYVGRLQRDKAGTMLKALPDGAFLVRDSENPARMGNPALSIKYSGTVRHIKIEHEKDKGYYMSDTRFFHTLPALVEYYQKNPLSDSFPEVQTSLLYPYKSAVNNPPSTRVLSYAVAVYDYAATATSQISLKVGDRVAVLSKTGSDRGWWKGEHCSIHKTGYFPFAYVKEEDEE